MEAREKIKELLMEVMRELGVNAEVKLEHPAEEEHGDYSSNIAMTMFGNFKFEILNLKLNSPLEFAKAIVEQLEKNEELKDYIEKIEVAQPGFINFWLSKDALCQEMSLVLEKGERYGSSDLGKGKTMVIDYSAPNVAKPFGIGHLRSTIIGQALYNLYNFLGWQTIGDNHLGDWGTQFGTLLYQITDKNLDPDTLDIEKLQELYVEFNTKAQENPDLKEEARLWFKKLEDGDVQARDIWKKVKDTSLQEYGRIYKLLGVEIDFAHGESFYEKMLDGIIEEYEQKGIAAEDQGALVIHFPNEEMTPAILRKSDGASTYLTRDLATIEYRQNEWKPDLIAYEVGAEQSLHFQQVFTAYRLLHPEDTTKFVHIKHGLYLSPSGKKFSTRRGDIVRLEEVLEEAIERAQKLAHGGDGQAKAVGIGAIKYFDLSHHPESNIIFDWEKMFVLEGNSAPYLQYTYARTESVLGKSGDQVIRKPGDQETWQPENLEPEELNVLKWIYRFPEVVEEAALNFAPNTVCTYLFELAQRYNTFYNKHRILGNQVIGESGNQVAGEPGGRGTRQPDNPTQAFRLALTLATGIILKTGLHLLGIQAPARM
ncbi:MAG: arginine--tRNA ligase [Candidatus Blackburnbacteria bacterium RIFCSPLOWO2_01_FULL_41_27]|uniref:Arginine--tRNA ligase n=1 Tax=Candidatus Blackburnbacteria bacterium RIFCSPLOWO2_01_FULL_41_27 TaxID=1797520 RepID=A0A1G1VB42_9BACT|nr:MAG: arginine--tRNA ligase [Candidatus Blackburnbacteria bacterium RIFCSPLOWO2_01_FULL_41_27]